MNKLSSLLLLFILLVKGYKVTAQVKPGGTTFTQTIKGTVVEKSSKLTMPGVTVKVVSVQPERAGITDANGIFHITQVPIGRQVVEISYAGYNKVVLSDVLVTTGKEIELNVEMETANTQLNEVVVSATSNKRPINSMAMASGRSFSPEETNRYAGALFDPARMAQGFAGVVAGGDNNEIIVRGNSPKSLQWRLEGIEIISPNHFNNEGSAGGGVSMLNSTVIGTSDFYTGALAAEYNNATAGVFDLRFRKGNTDKREYTFTAGVLGLGATMEGPFAKGGNASYLVSYRYSTLGLLKAVGVDVSDSGIPQYQDLSFNLVFPTRGMGTFSVFGVGGAGNVNTDAKRDTTKWDERMDSYDLRYNYKAGSVGLKNIYIANNRLNFSNIISFSGSRNASKVDSLTSKFEPSLLQKNHYDNTAIRYAGIVNYRSGENNNIRAGLNAGFLTYNLYDLEYQRDTRDLKELLNQKGSAATFDGFIQNKHDFGNKLSLNTGIHVNYFDLSKTWSYEPRAGLNWHVTPDQEISLAAGAYSRLEPLSFYFAKSAESNDAVSTKLSPTKSAQLVIGYEKLFSGHLKFKTEAYYQHLYDVPVSSDPANNFSVLNVSDNSAISGTDYHSLVNKGTGKNYGIEFSVERSLNKGYYFMITSSVFNSKYKALSGQEFNTTFNTQYVTNLVAGKEWATGPNHKNLFGLNGKLIYAGGRKYTPILVDETFQRDEQVIDQSKTNTLTADPYIRVDFSASYRINSKKVSHFLLLDIQNLLNRRNNTGLFYNQSKRIIEKNKWIGILPTINYRIEI